MKDRIFEKDPRFRHLEKKVGIFVLLTVLGLLAVIAFIGIEKDLFTKKYTVFFKVDSGSGFSEAMPVKLSGFKIGRIKGLSLDDKARVMVTVEINRKYQRWIRKGSVSRLMKEGMFGESFVEITVGPEQNEVVAEKGEVPFEKTAGMEELAKDIKPVIEEVKGILRYVNAPDGDIKKSLRNVAALTSEVRQTRVHIDGVLAEVKNTVKEGGGLIKGIEDRAYPIIDNAGKIVNSASAKMEPILDRMTGVAENLDKTSQRLPHIAEKLDAVLSDSKKVTGSLSNEAPRIKDVMDSTQDIMKDTNETIKGVKTSWPVNKMVSKKPDQLFVPLDGAEKDVK